MKSRISETCLTEAGGPRCIRLYFVLFPCSIRLPGEVGIKELKCADLFVY